MSEEIPQWAKEWARVLCVAEGHANSEQITTAGWDQFASFKALARYISVHEEAPVDPLENVLRAVGNDDPQGEREEAARLRVRLAEAGLEIREIAK